MALRLDWRNALRAHAVPLVYAAAYAGLVALSPYPASGAASLVLSGMRVGMTVAAVAARGARYLAFALLVSALARLGTGGTLSDWLSPVLIGVSITLLLAGLSLRWLSARLETRMDHVAALLAFALLATGGVFGSVAATGGSATLSKAICYAVGILVPMPLVFDVMKGLWPPSGRRALFEIVATGVLLTAANAWIFLGDSSIPLMALAVPMGLVIWSAARGGLAPASAALFNLTVFAGLSTHELAGAWRDGTWSFSSLGLLCAFAAICLFLGAYVDDLRLARRELKGSEGVLRSIFESSPIFMGIDECLGDDILLVRANAAMCADHGVPTGGLDGRRATELGYSKERLRFWLESYRASAVRGEPTRFDYEIETPAGKRWRSATVCPLGRAASGRSRFAYFIEDVTSRRRLEHERDRFFTVSLDFLCITGFDGLVKRANPACESVLGWKEREIENAHFSRFVHPDDLESSWAEFQRLVAGEPRTFTIRVLRKDGAYRWLLWSGASIPGGRLMYMAAKDVTAQKETEENLRQARDEAEAAARAKMEFLANMSHELRTPVNGIIGLTELALETELNDEARDYLETSRSSCDALLSVVNEVLDFSKIDAGALELESVGFDTASLVDGVVRVVEVRAREKGLSLRTRIASDTPPRLNGDPVRLRQVLLNLAGNAVKFTEGGWVRIEVEPVDLGGESALLRFAVADTGIGIPRDKLQAIFSPFTQADSSMTRRHGGTGLGLAIARRLVEAMGGELSVRSVPGQGSRFEFTLELPLERPAAEVSEPSSTSEFTRPLRILLAEDNRVNQLVAVRLLERLGHLVDTVEDGKQAVERVASGTYDVLLMDLQMPEMDGIEATRAIRDRERDRVLDRVPIVALTACATEDDREECLGAGMDGYLQKPFVRETLIEAIAGVVDRSILRFRARLPEGDPAELSSVER
jgi:PAS domain S-box-containing protein